MHATCAGPRLAVDLVTARASDGYLIIKNVRLGSYVAVKIRGEHVSLACWCDDFQFVAISSSSHSKSPCIKLLFSLSVAASLLRPMSRNSFPMRISASLQ